MATKHGRGEWTVSLVRAQLPEPQPGWAPQSNESLQPICARNFEPPAIAGSESRGVIRMLLRLHRETGDPAWLAPIPRALARALIDSLDARGAWVESKRLRYHGADDPTTRVIDCAAFAENLIRLAAYAGVR